MMIRPVPSVGIEILEPYGSTSRAGVRSFTNYDAIATRLLPETLPHPFAFTW